MKEGNRMKAVVIGAGMMGKKHAECYRETENAVLLGVIDSDPQRAADFAESLQPESIVNIRKITNSLLTIFVILFSSML